MTDKIKAKIKVNEFIGRNGLLTIYKNLIYFYGIEVGAYLSILIDEEIQWEDFKPYYKNDVSELPSKFMTNIENSLFITRERNLELLNQLLDMKLVSIIMNDDGEKFFFKLNQSELENKHSEYIEMLIKKEEEKQNEKQS